VKIEYHLDKVRRISEFRSRLDPLEDFELWMWAAMTAVTNAFNAALHEVGLTQPGDYYSYNAVGIYVVPPKVLTEWRKEVKPLGDLVHIGAPPVPFDFPQALGRAAEALQVLEGFRETSVRGNRPVTQADVQICDDAFGRAMAQIMPILSRYGPV
jgi:hypothetical protein